MSNQVIHFQLELSLCFFLCYNSLIPLESKQIKVYVSYIMIYGDLTLNRRYKLAYESSRDILASTLAFATHCDVLGCGKENKYISVLFGLTQSYDALIFLNDWTYFDYF